MLRPGIAPRPRWIVAASSGIAARTAARARQLRLAGPDRSLSRAAALPVGASSAMRGGGRRRAQRLLDQQREDPHDGEVLPVPGPPEMTQKRRSTAVDRGDALPVAASGSAVRGAGTEPRSAPRARRASSIAGSSCAAARAPMAAARRVWCCQ